MSRSLDWLEQNQQVLLNASELAITSVVQRYVRVVFAREVALTDNTARGSTPWSYQHTAPSFLAFCSSPLPSATLFKKEMSKIAFQNRVLRHMRNLAPFADA